METPPACPSSRSPRQPWSAVQREEGVSPCPPSLTAYPGVLQQCWVAPHLQGVVSRREAAGKHPGPPRLLPDACTVSFPLAGLFSTQPFPTGSTRAVPVLKLSHAEEEEGQGRRVTLDTDDLEYESVYGEEEDYDEVLEMDSSEQHAMGAEPCSLPLDEGDCQRYTLRWYYSQRVTECRPFVYSGCRGNLNRFDSKEECELHCGQRPAADARGVTGGKVGGQPTA
ncbi:uncharacterized protein LOC142415407 [Mycteria americana]|uniref:uncharacterized protein LOC142415407 n=1 Tax=Mycteria americana TaxID=33587 RepID=UPI003F58E09A